MSVPAFTVELITSSLITGLAKRMTRPNRQSSRVRATKSREARSGAARDVATALPGLGSPAPRIPPRTRTRSRSAARPRGERPAPREPAGPGTPRPRVCRASRGHACPAPRAPQPHPARRLPTRQQGHRPRHGAVGQSQLDRPVQILDDIMQPAGNLKNHCLTHDARSDPYLRAPGRTAGWARRELGGWQAADVVVNIGGKVGDVGRRLHHGELDLAVPESRTGPPRVESGTRKDPRHRGLGRRRNSYITPQTLLKRCEIEPQRWGLSAPGGPVLLPDHRVAQATRRRRPSREVGWRQGRASHR
jgi:hypothetical protein